MGGHLRSSGGEAGGIAVPSSISGTNCAGWMLIRANSECSDRSRAEVFCGRYAERYGDAEACNRGDFGWACCHIAACEGGYRGGKYILRSESGLSGGSHSQCSGNACDNRNNRSIGLNGIPWTEDGLLDALVGTGCTMEPGRWCPFGRGRQDSVSGNKRRGHGDGDERRTWV